MPTYRKLGSAVLTAGIASLAGCAIANPDNRLLLNAMDANLTPSSTAGKWALAPLALPAGLAAGVLDAAVVRPVTQLDDAWGDTVDVLWDIGDETTFRQAVLTPLAAIATPLVFAGSWVTRSIFDVGDREPAEDEDPDDELPHVGEGASEAGAQGGSR